MRLLALLYAHLDPAGQKTIINTREYSLGHCNFLYRGSVKEAYKFLVRETLQKLLEQSAPNQRHAVNHEEEVCYVQILDGRSAVFIFCDQEYPKRVVYTLLEKTAEVFRQYSFKLNEMTSDDNQDISQISKLFQDF